MVRRLKSSNIFCVTRFPLSGDPLNLSLSLYCLSESPRWDISLLYTKYNFRERIHLSSVCDTLNPAHPLSRRTISCFWQWPTTSKCSDIASEVSFDSCWQYRYIFFFEPLERVRKPLRLFWSLSVSLNVVMVYCHHMIALVGDWTQLFCFRCDDHMLLDL